MAYESDEEFQAKPRMRTRTKVLLALGLTGVVSLFACCGGAWWIVSNAFSHTQVPGEVQEVAESIATISIPPEYTPQVAVQIRMLMNMKMAVFARAGAGQPGHVLLMEMTLPGKQSPDEMKSAMRKQVEEQRGKQQEIAETSRETRTFLIDGEEREFEFIAGTDKDGKTVHQVLGLFPGRSGMVIFMMTEYGDNWDEEQAVRIIQSISTNGAPLPRGPEEAAPAENDSPPAAEPAPEAGQEA